MKTEKLFLSATFLLFITMTYGFVQMQNILVSFK